VEERKEIILLIHPGNPAKLKARIRVLTSVSNGRKLYTHQINYHGTSQVGWLPFLIGLILQGQGSISGNCHIGQQADI